MVVYLSEPGVDVRTMWEQRLIAISRDLNTEALKTMVLTLEEGITSLQPSIQTS